jgi:hypothetical protein
LLLGQYRKSNIETKFQEKQAVAEAAASHQPDIVTVFNCDANAYGGDAPNCDPFVMEVTDQRSEHGRMFIDVAPHSGNVDDMMPVTLEVNRLPGSSTDVQCMHVAFDDSNMAFSLFKQGGGYILRPEAGVTLLPTTLPDGTHAFIMEAADKHPDHDQG